MNGTDLLKSLWRIDLNKFAEADQESNQKSTESEQSKASEEKQE